MSDYHNEWDPYCAQWIRNLMQANLIPQGEVDERSITDVSADDLRGFKRWHFFSGIAGWALALRIADAADDSEVWTGSPPCQDNSFAAAVTGRRTGFDGARSGLAHKWLELLGAIRPRSVGFENVPGVRPWLHHITEGLGSLGYSVSESERSSQDIGAPMPRRRVWVFAQRDGARLAQSGESEPCQAHDDPRAAAPRNYWAETERGFRPLDDGIPERVAQVRAFGNAIDPHVAASLIRQHMDCRP